MNDPVLQLLVPAVGLVSGLIAAYVSLKNRALLAERALWVPGKKLISIPAPTEILLTPLYVPRRVRSPDAVKKVLVRLGLPG